MQEKERWIVLMRPDDPLAQKGLAYSLVIEGSVPFWDKEKIVYRPFVPELKANSAFAWKNSSSLAWLQLKSLSALCGLTFLCGKRVVLKCDIITEKISVLVIIYKTEVLAYGKNKKKAA